MPWTLAEPINAELLKFLTIVTIEIYRLPPQVSVA
jgi:hypothetical protein